MEQILTSLVDGEFLRNEWKRMVDEPDALGRPAYKMANTVRSYDSECCTIQSNDCTCQTKSHTCTCTGNDAC
jgi:hypothetical protein